MDTGVSLLPVQFFPVAIKTFPCNRSFKCVVGFELCQKVFERETVTLNECRPKKNKIGRFETAREQFYDDKRDSKFNLEKKTKTKRIQCV